MKRIATLIALILTGCGAIPAIDPAFSTQVSAFEAAYGHAVQVSISFTSALRSDQNGVCLKNGDVRVSASFWAIASDAEKEMLIFHELGHCVLNREHDTSLNSEGYPKSYMYTGNLDLNYPQVPWPKYMAAHAKEYREEMFK